MQKVTLWVTNRLFFKERKTELNKAFEWPILQWSLQKVLNKLELFFPSSSTKPCGDLEKMFLGFPAPEIKVLKNKGMVASWYNFRTVL